ncbi:flagellar hook-length control protein FliK [Salinicola halophyticus]|uniref:flagellar hook-length control protein FliK n=1 Tax=Salinicola halophyticus TaxID=1808881 RepID=UPI003F466AEB
MSGITPILDTLLHQVLGKRVDTPVIKDQPLPVSAATSSDAIQPARSDSRLHQQGGERVVGPSPATAREGASAPAPPPGQAGLSSSQLHLSPTAIKIADLLSHFPATQTASVRPLAALLLQPADSADSLATALSQSVRESGAFYESHLQRWMAGQYPRSALMREPQAWLSLTFRPFTPTSMLSTPMPFLATPTPLNSGLLTGGGRQALSQHVSPSSAPMPAKASTFAGMTAATANLDETVSSRAIGSGEARLSQSVTAAGFGGERSSSMAGVSDTASSLAMSRAHQLSQQPTEALQAIVRHQLELIVAPNLRWEGQLWPGVPMTLMFSELPRDPAFDDNDDDVDDRSPRYDDETRDEWRAEVQVRLPTLGVVDITFQARQATALRVEIDPSEAPTRDRVRRELEPLRQRLTALGIQAEIALGASHHER